VGEVDQLDDPVDERVTERDESEDHPVREADDRDLHEALGLVDCRRDQPVPDAEQDEGAEDPAEEIRGRGEPADCDG
jgi:hypothetical protein